MSDENKITITTKPRYYGRLKVSEPSVTFDSLQAAILEAYVQANQIGWETKVLDSLSDWIVNAHKQADVA